MSLNIENNLLNNKIKLKKFYSASLIVITDDSNEDYYNLTLLLNLFNKKLSDSGVFLRKTFLITKLDYADILKQLKHLVDKTDTHLNWILVTTTKASNDFLLNDLINDTFKNRQVKANNILNNMPYTNGHSVEPIFIYDNRVMLLKNRSFHLDLTLVLNHINLNQNRFVLGFNNETDMKKLNSKLNTFKVDYDYSNDSCYENDFIRVNKFFNNYSNYSIEIIVKDLSYLNSIRVNLNEYLIKYNDCLLLSNMLCADGFLYEFEYFSRCLIHHHNDIYKRMDIDFLLSRINIVQFLDKLKSTIDIVETALKMYTSEQLCVSFNGGKDCCVVLYLFYAVCLRLGYKFPLKILYIKIKNQFEEMNYFIDVIIRNYYGGSLEFMVFDEDSKSLKECLNDLKNKNSAINAIFMGTRRTDSSYFKNMPAFAPTDGDWPSFMRVNPILDWSYSEIWFFVRMLKLPYCSLYDHGYTSLDSSLNSLPNIDLIKPDGKYLPAYMLENQDSERKSRKPKS